MKKRAFAGLLLAAIVLLSVVNIIRIQKQKAGQTTVNSAAEEVSAEEVSAEEIIADEVMVNSALKDNFKAQAAGSVIAPSAVDFSDVQMYFQSYTIDLDDEVYSRISGKSYRENPDITFDQLRYIKVLHYNFDGEIQVGELIVNEGIEAECRNVFKELFENQYQIQSIRLIDDYWEESADAADIASMSANNSSAFCYRTITGGSSLSNHALGYAIDINPVQNPYVSGSVILPASGEEYVNRDLNVPHAIGYDDTCYKTFKKYGFTWGGDWSDPKDYQHFERR